jgi:hypothetical protein
MFKRWEVMGILEHYATNLRLRFDRHGHPSSAAQVIYSESKPLIAFQIAEARLKSLEIQNKLINLKSYKDRELFLWQAFLVCALEGGHYRIASFLSDKISPVTLTEKDLLQPALIAQVAVFPILWVIVCAVAMSLSIPLGERATMLWLWSLGGAVALDFVLLQPVKIWFESVFLVTSARSEILRLHALVTYKARFLCSRIDGFMRHYGALTQRFNPACRAARQFPELPVSRLLMAIYDYDLLWPGFRRRVRGYNPASIWRACTRKVVEACDGALAVWTLLPAPLFEMTTETMSTLATSVIVIYVFSLRGQTRIEALIYIGAVLVVLQLYHSCLGDGTVNRIKKLQHFGRATRRSQAATETEDEETIAAAKLKKAEMANTLAALRAKGGKTRTARVAPAPQPFIADVGFSSMETLESVASRTTLVRGHASLSQTELENLPSYALRLPVEQEFRESVVFDDDDEDEGRPRSKRGSSRNGTRASKSKKKASQSDTLNDNSVDYESMDEEDESVKLRTSTMYRCKPPIRALHAEMVPGSMINFEAIDAPLQPQREGGFTSQFSPSKGPQVTDLAVASAAFAASASASSKGEEVDPLVALESYNPKDQKTRHAQGAKGEKRYGNQEASVAGDAGDLRLAQMQVLQQKQRAIQQQHLLIAQQSAQTFTQRRSTNHDSTGSLLLGPSQERQQQLLQDRWESGKQSGRARASTLVGSNTYTRAGPGLGLLSYTEDMEHDVIRERMQNLQVDEGDMHVDILFAARHDAGGGGGGGGGGGAGAGSRRVRDRRQQQQGLQSQRVFVHPAERPTSPERMRSVATPAPAHIYMPAPRTVVHDYAPDGSPTRRAFRTRGGSSVSDGPNWDSIAESPAGRVRARREGQSRLEADELGVSAGDSYSQMLARNALATGHAQQRRAQAMLQYAQESNAVLEGERLNRDRGWGTTRGDSLGVLDDVSGVNGEPLYFE